MITPGQYLVFFAKTLDGMSGIVAELGDDLANRKMPLPGANSPYSVLNHCLGAIGYWTGEVVGGRAAHRDRAAEFTAKGPVEPLIDRVTATVRLLVQDVQNATPRSQVAASVAGVVDQGSALFHLYTDVVQHYGQLQIMRDALLSEQKVSQS